MSFLVDTNVLLDIATEDVNWRVWSGSQLQKAWGIGDVSINPIIYAELAPAFRTQAELDVWLNNGRFVRKALPYQGGWLAAQAFQAYKRTGGTKIFPLPDFYIGAHAAAEKLTLITRDVARYRSYFPSVTLITP